MQEEIMGEPIRYQMAKLNQENYFTWRIKIELFLIRDNLWDVVETAPPANHTDPWYKKDRIARAAIGLLIEDNLLIDIKDCSTAKHMLENLKCTFENNSFGTQIHLMRRLFNTKYVEGTSMLEHLNLLKETVSKLSDMGERLSEKLVSAAMLGSLPPEYGNLITAIEGRPNKDITLSFIKAQILEEAKRRVYPGTTHTTNNKALLLQENKYEQQNRSYQCFYCGKTGHIRKDCRKLRNHQFHQRLSTPDKYANNPNTDTQQTHLTVSGPMNVEAQSLYCNHLKTLKDWIIDSGATKHVLKDRSSFISLKQNSDNSYVNTASGKKEKIHSIGEAIWKFQDTSGTKHQIILHQALYVPNVTNNLISVQELTSHGMKVKFTKQNIQLKQPNSDIVLLSPENGKLITPQDKSVANPCIHDWHDRLGHCHLKKIKMDNNHLTSDMHITPCAHKNFCDTCAQTKSVTKAYPKMSSYRATKTFEHLHVDLCGPISPSSIGGNSYLLTISDDYSRYVKVKPIAHKHQASKNIIEFIEHNYNRLSRYPSYIRTDNGGEFLGGEFEEFLKSKGIYHLKTVPFSPPQNGVAERINRIIIKSVRCQIQSANLTKNLWGEAAACASPHNRLEKTHLILTPFELWFGFKPSIKHLRRYGETCCYHIPGPTRLKLDNTAKFGCWLNMEKKSRIPNNGLVYKKSDL